ncbi:MAG: DMT family transporter [Candidatus Micrarchaeota archaeon]|nr:DMT family transporter [Candidatus Micrarchaeota archaeon]
MISIGTIAAVLAVLSWAISLVIEKRIVTILGKTKGAALVIGLGVLPMLILSALSFSLLDPAEIALAAISGIFLSIGFVLYYKSLETEQISNTSGTGLLQPALLIIFSVFVLSEPLTLPQIIGGIVIFLGIILILTTERMELNRNLIPAIMAQVSWALYWIFATYAILGSHKVAIPLLISRVVAFISGAALFPLLLKKDKISRRSGVAYIAILLVIAGILDGAGNILFGKVVSLNELQVGSIFSAMVPIVITGLGYVVYKERLTRLQAIGMLAAVIGALIIAIF